MKSHGGARQGAGLRKGKKLSGGKLTPLYLDNATRTIFESLGNGNMSEGARLAGDFASRHHMHPTSGSGALNGALSTPESQPSNYVLISFYKTSQAGKDIWLVYGHRYPGNNDELGEFGTEKEAIDKALSYSFLGVPMIRGENHDDVLEKLAIYVNAQSSCPVCGAPTDKDFNFSLHR